MNHAKEYKRNYAKEYKKRVNILPEKRAYKFLENAEMVRVAIASLENKKKSEALVYISDYKSLSKEDIKRHLNTDINNDINTIGVMLSQNADRCLPRWRNSDNVLQMLAYQLALVKHEQEQDLISYPLTLLLSDKSYGEALASDLPVISYLHNLVANALRKSKHLKRKIDFILPLEVAKLYKDMTALEILSYQGNENVTRRLPHLHLNILCTPSEYKAVRVALKSINKCKKSSAFDNDTKKFNQLELECQITSRIKKTLGHSNLYSCLFYANYVTKNHLQMRGDNFQKKQRGLPVYLPHTENLFSATTPLTQTAKGIYEQIKKAHDEQLRLRKLEAVESDTELDAFSAMLDERLNANFNPNDTTGGTSHTAESLVFTENGLQKPPSQSELLKQQIAEWNKQLREDDGFVTPIANDDKSLDEMLDDL